MSKEEALIDVLANIAIFTKLQDEKDARVDILAAATSVILSGGRLGKATVNPGAALTLALALDPEDLAFIIERIMVVCDYNLVDESRFDAEVPKQKTEDKNTEKKTDE